MSNKRAAIYVEDTAGYPNGDNSRDLQTRECERHCEAHGLDIVARYYDGVGIRRDFERTIAGKLGDARGNPTYIFTETRVGHRMPIGETEQFTPPLTLPVRGWVAQTSPVTVLSTPGLPRRLPRPRGRPASGYRCP